MSACTGNCCEKFTLPASKEILNRWVQNQRPMNGTMEETRMVADMVIPMEGGRCVDRIVHDGKNYRLFSYTCRHFNVETRRCSIYEKRPVLCRTYPDRTACRHKSCPVQDGTNHAVACDEFKEANNVRQKPSPKT